MIVLLTMTFCTTGANFLPAKGARGVDGSLEEGTTRRAADLACEAEALHGFLYRRR